MGIIAKIIFELEADLTPTMKTDNNEKGPKGFVQFQFEIYYIFHKNWKLLYLFLLSLWINLSY